MFASFRSGLILGSAFVAAGSFGMAARQAAPATAHSIALKPNKHIPGVVEGRLTQGPPPDRLWYKKVGNHSSSPIVALFAAFHCGYSAPPSRSRANTWLDTRVIPGINSSGGNRFIIYDSLSAETANFEIPPGGSTRMDLRFPIGYVRCSGGVKTVLFADGRSEGNRVDMWRMYRQRQGIYAAIGRSIPLLEQVANGKMSLEQGLGTLHGYSQSLRYQINPGAAFPSGSAGYASDPAVDSLYTLDGMTAMVQFYRSLEASLSPPGSALRKFYSHYLRGGFPWRPAGSKQPTVDQVAQARPVSPDQARAVILLNELQQWRAALKGHLKPAKGESVAR